MPEESSPAKDLGSVIPSFYYDLIARVSAGVPFLVVLLLDDKACFKPPDPSVGAILALAFGGYLVGLILSSFSGVFLALIKLVLNIIPLAKSRFSNPQLLSLNSPLVDDALGIKDKEAGATLAKVAAELVLSQNMLLGFTVLLVIQSLGHPIYLISSASSGLLLVIWIMLLVVVVHRSLVYLIRFDRMLTLFPGG
ncbi:MAG: hypothetical protein LAP21_25930 [Acidobacteriia bacterium]|nr:hypothetical protein [Terriglobia bacterium]